jgi:hypothetical protein
MIDVLPGYWSFAPLNVPSDASSAAIYVPEEKAKNISFLGRIVNRLYDNIDSDEFNSVHQANSNASSPLSVLFEDINAINPNSYFAVETFSVLPENGHLKDASLKLPLRVEFYGMNLGEVQTEMIADQSLNNLLLKVKAPATISTTAAHSMLSIKIANKEWNFPIIIKE